MLQFAGHPAGASSAWQSVLLGGGGFQRSMDIHADGTIATQTDVFAGYVGSTVVDTVFRQLVTKTSMPAAYSTSVNPYQGAGISALRIAPSNSSILYMVYTPFLAANSKLFVSQDKGVTWTDANFGPFQADANDSNDFINWCQPRIAIDPLNPAICFIGTEAIGMWTTTNGLSVTPTWTQISANSFPTTGTNPGVTSMQYDPTSGSGGVTQRLIVGVAGSGVWVTANGGTTWTKITGSPTNPGKGAVGSDGTYYCTQRDGAKIWRLSTANALTDITPGADQYFNIAIDPNNPARGVAGVNGGFFNLCTNAINTGTPTWAGVNPTHNLNANANQPAWQQAVNDNFLTDGMLLFDPFVTTSSTSRTIGTGSFSYTVGTGLNIVVGDLLRFSQTGTPANFMLGTVTAYNSGTGAVTITETSNGGSGTIAAWTVTKERLWFSWGCGISYTDGILTSGTQQWQIQFAGIENLVTNQVVWPPAGNPFAACWDRPFWNLAGPNTYQTGYHPAYPTGIANRVIFGSSVDWAKSTPSFLVGLAQDPGSAPFNSGFSTDSGVTWTPFPAIPAGTSGANGGAGTIAACDTNRIVVARNNNNGLYQTQNQGVSWALGTGAPTSGWGTSGFNTSSYRVAADCVNIGTFYAYNDGASAGIWISTDGGQSWSATAATGVITGDTAFLPQLKTVPNIASTSTAGHFFLTGGQDADLGTTHPQNVPFYRSINGGTSLTTVANVKAVITFGFGAPKPGNSYPAIYIVGWVSLDSGVTYNYGVWRSDDNAATWTFMVDFPPRTNYPGAGGWIDTVTTMEGNPNSWNSCIVGFLGSSFVRFGPTTGY